MVTQAEGSAVAISREEMVKVMVNEEDHLRIQVLEVGISPGRDLEVASKIDDQFDKGLPLRSAGLAI